MLSLELDERVKKIDMKEISLFKMNIKMRIKLKGKNKDEKFFPHSQIYCKVREFLKVL